jgi:sugar phosphate isomerase/epimerase
MQVRTFRSSVPSRIEAIGGNMDPQRISCCSIALHGHPVDETMTIVATAGFRKIDLLGRLPHLAIDAANCDPAKLKATATAHGLQIANLGTYCGRGFASEDPALQQLALSDLRTALDWAVYLGAGSIRISPGNDDPACIERIVPWFRQAAEYAAQRNVRMGIENHGGGISGQPDTLRRLAEAVGSPFFGALYEPANLMLAGVEYRAAYEAMRGHITHVHCKDGRKTGEGFVMTMLGEGEIDYRWVIARLEADGYHGDYALEYEVKSEPAETGLAKWYRTFAAL